MKRINSSVVPEKYSGYRVDKYLADRFSYLSRSKWQGEIKKGKIFCNNSSLRSFHKILNMGDVITYSGSDQKEPEVDPEYKIIFEDNYILAVDKSGNLPVHPAGRFFNNTLLTIMQKNMSTKLHPVHRLDRETSGIVLFAKNSETASLLQRRFSCLKKEYLVIVHGLPGKERFTIDMPIGPDTASIVRKKRRASTEGSESALTHFSVIEKMDNYTLLKAEPVTGRLHQIRVHLNYAGHPILGDKLYGINENLYLTFIEKGNCREILSRLKFSRTALHSSSIAFNHPYTGKGLKIRAPLHADILKFISGQKNLKRSN